MNSKRIVMGIDTGGTYTDGILLDIESDKVLAKSKANTTKDDLSIGIGKCIKQLDIKDDISLVCLSTTLATNSVVEGKKTRVGLIMMYKYDPERSFAVDMEYSVSGIIDITGDIEEELNEEEILAAIRKMKGRIDSLVISGYLSVRNPVHELRIKELAKEYMDVPIICAHELSSSLGFFERTDTAVLNAHLMPVIDDLIRKTKYTLQQSGIDAEIAVIKGDGTMMNINQALERPVETVLSGPAASVVGGSYLTDKKDALFVDLGGTTLDIASMKNGKVSVTEDGASISGWKTKVKAVDIYTFGLGGDSRLVFKSGKYSFGSMKAVPICYANEKYPYLIDEIKSYSGERPIVVSGFNEMEALILNGDGTHTRELSATERDVIKLISDGPRSISYIARNIKPAERIIGIDNMLEKGIVSVVSITPTDLMHATGDYVEWDSNASVECIRMAAAKLKLDFDEAVDALTEKFLQQLAFAIIKSSFSFDGNYHRSIDEDNWLYNMLFNSGENTGLKCTLNRDIVAIGAPAEAWITKLGDKLNAAISVPPNYEVANAIGAAKGQINRKVEVFIRLNPYKSEYRVHLPWEMAIKENFEEARAYVLQELESYTERIKQETQIYNYEKSITEDLEYLDPNMDSSVVYECKMALELTAAPKCFETI